MSFHNESKPQRAVTEAKTMAKVFHQAMHKLVDNKAFNGSESFRRKMIKLFKLFGGCLLACLLVVSRHDVT